MGNVAFYFHHRTMLRLSETYIPLKIFKTLNQGPFTGWTLLNGESDFGGLLFLQLTLKMKGTME